MRENNHTKPNIGGKSSIFHPKKQKSKASFSFTVPLNVLYSPLVVKGYFAVLFLLLF